MDISFGTTIMDVTRYANVPDTARVQRRVGGARIPRTRFGSANVHPMSIYFNVGARDLCMRRILKIVKIASRERVLV